MLNGYPKVYNLGHPDIRELLDGDVVVQEKVDGSQFSACCTNGVLEMRSHHQQVQLDCPPKLFALAVESVVRMRKDMTDGCVYRFEYLAKPKHNALAYDKVPTNNLVLFDIEDFPNDFEVERDRLENHAKYLGVDVVPEIWRGRGADLTREMLDQFLGRLSFLGGQKIEGVVIKNYRRFSRDAKVMMGKHVSEAYKEVHKKDWKDSNPSQTDIVERIGQSLRTEARWNKSIQHLKERGELTNTPQDIGKLMKECGTDIYDECSEEVKTKLFDYAWPKIQRIAIRGLAEYYKKLLADSQFGEKV